MQVCFVRLRLHSIILFRHESCVPIHRHSHCARNPVPSRKKVAYDDLRAFVNFQLKMPALMDSCRRGSTGDMRDSFS